MIYYNSIEEALVQLEKEIKEGKHPKLRRINKWERK